MRITYSSGIESSLSLSSSANRTPGFGTLLLGGGGGGESAGDEDEEDGAVDRPGDADSAGEPGNLAAGGDFESMSSLLAIRSGEEGGFCEPS